MELFKFKENTLGLPNHLYINNDGTPSNSILRNHLGLDRRRDRAATACFAKRDKDQPPHFLTGKKFPLIDRYAHQKWRKKLFFIFIRDYLRQLKSDPKKEIYQITGKVTVPSWELIILDAYARDLFLESDLMSYTDIMDAKSEGYEGFTRELGDVLNRIYERFLKETKDWATLAETKQIKISEICFALSTVYDYQIFNICLNNCKGIEKYFSKLMSLSYNIDLSEDETDALLSAESEEELYQKIINEATKGLNNPLSTEIVQNIKLLADKLETWIEQHQLKITPLEVINEWCERLFSYGADLEIPLCDVSEDDIVNLFYSEWYQYFTSEEAQELSADDLHQLNHLRKELAAQLKAEAITLKAEEQVYEEELIKLKCSAPGSLLEKRNQQKREGELRTRIQEKEAAILEKQDEAMIALMPPETPISLLSKETPSELPEFDESHISTILSGALIEFHARIEQESAFQTVSDYEEEPEDSVVYEEVIEKKGIEFIPKVWADKEIAKEEAEVLELEAEQDDTSDYDIEHAQTEPNDAGSGIVAEVKSLDISTNKQEAIADIELKSSTQDVWGNQSEFVAETKQGLQEDVIPKSNPTETDYQIEQTLDSADIATVFRQEIEKGFINGSTINCVIVRYILNDQLAIAHHFITQVEALDVREDHFAALLLKSAYYGFNNWDYGHSLTKSQRLLAKITQELIEKWSDQPSSAVVPYLILVAAFQPALFGGNYSRAPYLLKDIAPFFEKQTRQLIEATVDLAVRNQFVNMTQLRSGGTQALAQNFDPAVKLEPWIQKIMSTHRGYAPVLKAQRKCLEQGAFEPIVKILKTNDRSKTASVESFVAQMQNEESSDQLLEQSLKDAGQSIPLLEIFGRERRSFQSKVMDLVDIAKDWLAINKAKHGSDTETYCRKFATQLEHVINELSSKAADDSVDEVHRAGANMAAKAFARLQSVVQGSDHMIWDDERVKVWFSASYRISRLDGIGNSPLQQISWLLGRLDAPFDTRMFFRKALENNDITLAEVLRLDLDDNAKAESADKESVRKALEALKQQLICQAKRLRSQVENANLSSLIGDSQAEKLDAELDVIQGEVEDLDVMADIADIRDRLIDIEKDICSRTSSKKEALLDEYRNQLIKLRSSVPIDPVPEQWEKDIEQAFKDDNLPVITEMLDELNTAIRTGRRIQFSRIQDVQVLQGFLAVQDQILAGINSCANHKDIWHRVVNVNNHFGIDFNNRPSALKKVVDAIAEWSTTSRPANKLDKELYEKTASILLFLGFAVKETTYRGNLDNRCNYIVTQGAAAFNVELNKSGSQRPFSLFGESSSPDLVVIVAYKDWTPEQIEKLLSSKDFSSSIPLLISAKPMSNEKRNAFSLYFKRAQKTVLHLDMTTALYLGHFNNAEAENAAIRNFLWLVTPFTYYNPYVGGDTRYPPPREMRYGRATEIDSLLQMNNGSAIVFGGRQLGKSTILQEVHSRFHQPSKQQFAFYHHLDDMDRMDLSDEDWKRTELKVWGYIYDDLYNAKIITEARTASTTPDMIQMVVKNALKERKDAKVIIIFDEIDPVLNVDNAHDFKLVRALRGPVNDPEIQGRFKIIIAGLESVKRFENSPNYPLPQLGGSIQVTIMPTQDAIQLIREPFLALGYTFENAQVVNRILAITNRHPGLIQIFCHQLVCSLSINQHTNIGECVVTDDEVSTVYQLQDVLDLIRSRFEMTLNLDLRYLVIIYGLINEGKAADPFSPREAKEIAEAWLPKEFTKLSEKQFEAFLVEMVGLGVLRIEKQGLSNRYALRNTNVLKLLGSDGGAEVERNLNRALQEYLGSDPLDRHAYLNHDDGILLSPITYRDEKEILGTLVKEQSEPELGYVNAQLYSVSIIVGSDAMGASALKKALPYIYEADFSRQNNSLTKRQYKQFKQYKLIAKDDIADESPKQFADRLNDLLTKNAVDQPIMLYVTITGCQPLAATLALLDAAHAFNALLMKERYPVRVIFYLTPRAYYQWLQSPDLTRDREGNQPFIKLGKWGKAALRYALDKIGMQSASDEVEELERISQGWYISIEILAKIKENRKKIHELRDLRQNYIAMDKAKLAEAKQFYKAAGIGEFSWVHPLIQAISQSGIDDITVDDLFLIGEEKELFGPDNSMDSVEQMAIWMADMNLLRRYRKHGSAENFFCMASEVQHAVELIDSAN